MKSKKLSRYANPAEQLQKHQLQQRHRNPQLIRLAPEALNPLKKKPNQAKLTLRENQLLRARDLRTLAQAQILESVAEAETSMTIAAVEVETQETVIDTVIATVIADAVAAEAETTARKPNQRFPQMTF